MAAGKMFLVARKKNRPVRRRRRTLPLVKRVDKLARQMAMRELKFYDITIASASTSTSGTVLKPFNVMGIGDTSQTRDGNQIVVKNWSYNIRFDLPANTLTAQQFVRVITFISKTANNTTPNSAQFLHTTTYDAYRNLDNTQKFTILSDKTHVFKPEAYDNGGVPGALAQIRHVRFNKAFKQGLPVKFSHGETTPDVYASIETNALGMLIISNGTAVTYTLDSRVRFTDP